MWQLPILQKIHDAVMHNGILVTYCAQGQFRRNLKSLGFKVESLPGPPGKREMTSARKN
jgi:tRNA U34 5-methylaminomethyl-2-thiouridine-forming methyltransferase MnmC